MKIIYKKAVLRRIWQKQKKATQKREITTMKWRKTTVMMNSIVDKQTNKCEKSINISAIDFAHMSYMRVLDLYVMYCQAFFHPLQDWKKEDWN